MSLKENITKITAIYINDNESPYVRKYLVYI